MRVAGIIAEYNPFHRGHEYHIKETKINLEADFVIVAMSGNFVQRGEPAIFNKYVRTKMALECGADMVIEIPALFSSASAEFFAFAGVKLLEDTGIVQFLSFGSEEGNLEELEAVAKVLAKEPDAYKKSLKESLSKGFSFPSARENALNEMGFRGRAVAEPNNILGTEYLKALIRLKSNIKPFTLKRLGSGYNSLDKESEFPSAAALRRLYRDKQKTVSSLGITLHNAYNTLIEQGEGPVFLKNLEPYINFRIRTLGREGLRKIEDVTEGLENRIISSPWDIEEKIDFIKSKRYTRTKIQRMLIHILLGIEKDFAAHWRSRGYVPYIKVLGFRRSAQILLDAMQKNSRLPVVVNLRDGIRSLEKEERDFFEKDLGCDDIYRMAYPNPLGRVIGKDYNRKVMKIL